MVFLLRFSSSNSSRRQPLGEVVQVFHGTDDLPVSHPTNSKCRNNEGKSELTPNRVNRPITSSFLHSPPDSWRNGRCSLYVGRPTPIPQSIKVKVNRKPIRIALIMSYSSLSAQVRHLLITVLPANHMFISTSGMNHTCLQPPATERRRTLAGTRFPSRWG